MHLTPVLCKKARKIADRASSDFLLAIEDPQPVDAPSLPNARHEVKTAISVFPKSLVLKGRQATRDEVLRAMPNCNVLHFACHGHAEISNPLESYLCVAHNSKLTLRDLMESKLPNIRLAVLSACETAVSGTPITG